MGRIVIGAAPRAVSGPEAASTAFEKTLTQMVEAMRQRNEGYNADKPWILMRIESFVFERHPDTIGKIPVWMVSTSSFEEAAITAWARAAAQGWTGVVATPEHRPPSESPGFLVVFTDRPDAIRQHLLMHGADPVILAEPPQS